MENDFLRAVLWGSFTANGQNFGHITATGWCDSIVAFTVNFFTGIG